MRVSKAVLAILAGSLFSAVAACGDPGPAAGAGTVPSPATTGAPATTASVVVRSTVESTTTTTALENPTITTASPAITAETVSAGSPCVEDETPVERDPSIVELSVETLPLRRGVVYGTPAGVRPSVTFEVPAEGWSAMNMVCSSNLEELIVSHGGRPPAAASCSGRGCDLAVHVFPADEATADGLEERLDRRADAVGVMTFGEVPAVWYEVEPAEMLSLPAPAESIWRRIDVVPGQRARVFVVNTPGTAVVVVVAATTADFDRMIDEARAVLATVRFADTDHADRCG